MSTDSTRRWPAPLWLAVLLGIAIAMLPSGGLGPAALAQDAPSPPQVTPIAAEAEDDADDEPRPAVDSERGTASVGGITAIAGGSASTPDQAVAPPDDPEPADPADAAAAGVTPAGDTPPLTAGQAVEASAAASPGRRDVAQPSPAGRGGAAEAGGVGGTIDQSAAITGNNRGSTINVEDCAYGSVQIDGGTVVNATDVSLSANGGLAVSTANGGDDNVVQAGGAIASREISAGNGGESDSTANGGTIETGAMITGNNRGHEVNFADCPNGRGDARLIIDAGDITNTTTIDVSANGGSTISDASGGSGNLGIAGGLGDAAAGNGGAADSAANGGTIETGAMITGNNRGNTITVGQTTSDGTTSDGAAVTGSRSCTVGPVTLIIDGGDVLNDTSINLNADGGTAIGEAGGGSDNLGLGGAGVVGNGGDAKTAANGGAIRTGAIITGNNRGNSISAGNVSGCAAAPLPANVPAAAPRLAAPWGTAAAPAPARVVNTQSVVRGVQVQALPNTGSGPVAGTVSVGQFATVALMTILVSGLGLRRRRARTPCLIGSRRIV